MESRRQRLSGIGLAALIIAFVSVAIPGSAERTYPDAVQITISPEVADDSAAAFVVSEGANGYIEVDTTDGAEQVTIGNLTTDPDVVFDTAGLVDVSTGSLDVPAGASMLINGVAAPAAWTAANLADLTDGGATTLHTHTGLLQTATVSIPGGNGAGSVGTLNSTAVTMVPAQGADTVIIPTGVHYWLDYGGVAYDDVGAAETLVLFYEGGTDGITAGFTPTGFGNATADEHRWDYPDTEAAAQLEILENTAVQLKGSPAGSWYSAAGNSPLIVSVTYFVIDYTPSP